MCLSHGTFIPHLTAESRQQPEDADWSRPGEFHLGRLSSICALGPRLREDDGQGNWALCPTRKHSDDGTLA